MGRKEWDGRREGDEGNGEGKTIADEEGEGRERKGGGGI